MDAHPATRWTQFITPLGGIVALICFFTPWLETDTRINFAISGFSWIQAKPAIGIAWSASLAIIGLSFYMIIRRTPWKALVIVLISSGIGLSVLLQEYLHFVAFAEMVDFTVGFGFLGTFVGFAVAVVGMFLTKTETIEGRNEIFVANKNAWYIAYVAGIGALVCFFMPWNRIGTLTTQSGFNLAKSNSLIGIAFTASVAIVIINYCMLKQDTHWKSKKPIFISSGIGIGTIIAHYITYFDALRGVNALGIDMRADTLEFGLWGTVIGFVIAALGMFLLKTTNNDEQVEVSET